MAKDLIPVVTPVGDLWYVNITGQGKRNYNDDGYEYGATVYLTGDAATELKDKLLEVLGPTPKGKTVKSYGFRELLKDAEGTYTPTTKTVERDKKAEKTGIFAFAFKTGATFEDGRQKKVAVYNAKRDKVDMGEKLIGNGSKGAISGNLKRNERGPEIMVSCFLNAVQLTEYVPYVSDAGFEEQDGSFVTAADADGGFPVEGTVANTTAPEKEKIKPRL